MEINNIAIILVECLWPLSVFHNSVRSTWFNSCWVSIAYIEFSWSWGAQHWSDSRWGSGKGIQNVFSAILLHGHTLCSLAFFFLIFLKANNCNGYEQKCELWSFKMFAVKRFAFFIKLETYVWVRCGVMLEANGRIGWGRKGWKW